MVFDPSSIDGLTVREKDVYQTNQKRICFLPLSPYERKSLFFVQYFIRQSPRSAPPQPPARRTLLRESPQSKNTPKNYTYTAETHT